MGSDVIKVLLINAASFHVKHKAAIPLGLLSIATYLKNNGHTVQIYDRSVDSSGLKKYISSFEPDIAGISALAFKSFPDAIKLSKTLKNRNIPVVWGGQMPSFIPDTVLKSGVVDYVVMGEGEITILALINAIIEKTPFHDIDGLAYIENGEPVINKDREFADLSQLPIIDFSFVDPSKYFVSNVDCKKMLHIYTSKGCPYHCSYCYSSSFSKGIWRARPAEYFLNEIRYLVENFGMDGVYFADDLFSKDRDYLDNICKKIITSNMNFVWGCDMRADICTKEELKLMYDAGCRWIFFGIESGSEERQKKIRKRIELNKAVETINYCNEIGIVTTTSFIIGFPDETEEELMQTLIFMRDLNSGAKIPSFYGPIPKSELYNYLVDSKKIEVPKTYKEWESFKMMDLFGKNYSKVPDIELKVVSAYFYLESFLRKYPNNHTQSRVFAKKAFKQTFDVLKLGTFNSIRLVVMSAKELLEIVYFATMHPKILKKYGLSNKFKKHL